MALNFFVSPGSFLLYNSLPLNVGKIYDLLLFNMAEGMAITFEIRLNKTMAFVLPAIFLSLG